jgi:probable addiction module antidote protein
MALETLPWDPAEHLKTAEDVREYLEAAFEDGAPALIAAALGDVARSRNAREAGISREAMYKAFRPEGNPTLDTLARVIRALGLKLTVRAA